MHAGFGLALALAFAFAVTNGFHDASNAIATLVATRAAGPLQAVVLASVFNVLGPLVVGAAVADTIGGASRWTRRAVSSNRWRHGPRSPVLTPSKPASPRSRPSPSPHGPSASPRARWRCCG